MSSEKRARSDSSYSCLPQASKVAKTKSTAVPPPKDLTVLNVEQMSWRKVSNPVGYHAPDQPDKRQYYQLVEHHYSTWASKAVEEMDTFKTKFTLGELKKSKAPKTQKPSPKHLEDVKKLAEQKKPQVISARWVDSNDVPLGTYFSWSTKEEFKKLVEKPGEHSEKMNTDHEITENEAEDKGSGEQDKVQQVKRGNKASSFT